MKVFVIIKTICLFLLTISFLQLQAQTNSDIFDIPILAVPKSVANAGERAVVIITWEGSFNTKLKVGDIETYIKSGEQVGVKLLVNKSLKLSIETDQKKKFTSSETLMLKEEMAYLNIGFSNEKIHFKYETFKQREIAKRKEEDAQLEAKLKEDLKKASLKLVLDSIEMNMVHVEGGDFVMGCITDDNCYTNYSKPSHNVTLSNYFISKFEVTRAQWRLVMGKDSKSRYNEVSCDKCPVENVSWNEVQTFITKLNKLTGKNYRLPTEAEWEFAAKGGKKSKGFLYSGSNNLDEVSWYAKNHGNRMHEVGTKLPNELGIYDMSGNVSEWCSDGYCKYDDTPKINPTGCNDDSDKVVRGGNMAINPEMLAITSRRGATITFTDFELIGFRLAHGK